MRKFYLLFFVLLPCILPAQTGLKHIRQKSYQLFAFKVNASNIERYIRQDSIPIDDFITQTPVHIFHKDSVNTGLLPNGHYVLISIEGNEVVANMIGIADLVVYPVNNQYNIQLEVRTQSGIFVPDASVWVNNKKTKYNKEAKTYWLRQKKVKEALIKVFTPLDTVFLQLEANDDYVSAVWAQRWNNFKITKTGRIVNYLPRKISYLFKNRRRYKPNNTGAVGYILFNQPKYKLSDTVRLKAYIVNRKWKQYKEKTDVFLEYRAKSKDNNQLLANLSPVSPGSYVYSFPLSDTLSSDTRYNIVFKTKKGKTILSKDFSTEDYLLDEIGSYQLRTKNENYYYNDTVHFYASAKDANGLALLDGKAVLILTTNSINDFYRDTLQVPDTLLVQEKPLATDRETTFSLPANSFPYAQLTINASLVFRNSNNEIHEEKKAINYSPGAKELVASVEDDSVFATYRVDGKSVSAQGVVEISGDEISRSATINFPVRLKIDPMADEYEFTLIEGADTLTKKIGTGYYYGPRLSRISRQDTLGFALSNPYKIPVSFVVLNGNALVYAGKDDKEEITWKTIARNKRKMYTVKWQYSWGGEQRQGQESIALLYKLLQVNVNNEATVFPGQKDTITIEVKDYKNQPAEGVNLAAVAYNSQFKTDIEVREPPYLVKYKNKRAIIRDRHETEDPYILKKYKLGNHPAWIKRMGVDTMQSYKILFPKLYPYDVVAPISGFIPQLSIHVVQKGQPQEIYLLYVNRQLVYYNGVTDKMNYAFETMQGFTQIGIRLFDKYIQVDSLYAQPFYKHDIVIDLDSLPPHSVVSTVPNYWTGEERKLIEKSTWQLDNNFKTNNGYAWQYNRLVKLKSSSKHLVGPFNPLDSLHFYAPGNFDIHFIFEPGYEYNLSKQISRLEKKTIFPSNVPKIWLPKFPAPVLVLGDTVAVLPIIAYQEATKPEPFIRVSGFPEYNAYSQAAGNGKLQFATPADTMLKYIVLFNDDSSFASVIRNENVRSVKNIIPGRYTLLLVNRSFETAEIKNLLIKSDQTLCLNAAIYPYEKNNRIVDELIRRSMLKVPDTMKGYAPKPGLPKSNLSVPGYISGNYSIKGRIVDAEGKNGVYGASVTIKGTSYGAATGSDGSFSISNIREGRYILVAVSIGYMSKETSVMVERGRTTEVNIVMTMSSQSLDEVVVTGLAVVRRRLSITGSIATVNGAELSSGYLSNALQGRAAGLSVSGEPGDDKMIRTRGISGFSDDSRPIYVVDGIIYNELPPNIKPEMIQSAEVLKDAAATAIYGARGANGAIIITTGSKTIRSKFSDNAIWQPELFTNAEGKVSFEVVYPDNITGWQLYVLAMDKKRRMGKGMSFTKAYKPLLAQLNAPQFLIVDDSVQLIGKALNYTADNYSIQTRFSLDGKLLYSKDTLLPGSQSSVTPLSIITNNADTVNASYTLRTTTGFSDGEERKIPVFKKGSEETNGSFYILQTDTTLRFLPIANGGPVEVYAQNNTLDILLNELDHLKKYPYYCMEQIASKLKGLLMEKQIREIMKQPFKNEKDINILLRKLQDSQLFDGGWSWWERGKANLPITVYVVEALTAYRKNPLVETNLRNGLLYLQNQLAYVKKDELLQVLSALSTANHAIDYKPYLDKLNFDSLTQHQQWQWVKISQQQKLDYSSQLKKLVNKQTATMTNGVHWGTENYLWYNNTIATTVLAYSVVEKENEYLYLLPRIIQFFLEQRKAGFWRNTVESASITSAILPYILETNKNFNAPAVISLNGDTSITVSSFPYATTLSPKSAKPIAINKTGGGLTYLTLYQKWWNERPNAVTDKFDITTYFEKNGRKVLIIPAGEKVKMMVKVNVLRDADYVMIEIPIPAGCNYANKNQQGGMHKEFYKNKVVLFSETLQKGIHEFEIELESRYKGSFTLNPTKAELMYFPVLYGRNEMTRVEIR